MPAANPCLCPSSTPWLALQRMLHSTDAYGCIRSNRPPQAPRGLFPVPNVWVVQERAVRPRVYHEGYSTPYLPVAYRNQALDYRPSTQAEAPSDPGTIGRGFGSMYSMST